MHTFTIIIDIIGFPLLIFSTIWLIKKIIKEKDENCVIALIMTIGLIILISVMSYFLLFEL